MGYYAQYIKYNIKTRPHAVGLMPISARSTLQDIIIVAQEKMIDEDSCVIQIKESIDALQEAYEEEKELSMSVFNVPNELLAENPEAYIPQIVSIGPYHHWRFELYNMERHKLTTICIFKKRMKE